MKRQARNPQQLYEAMRNAIHYMREHANRRPGIKEVAAVAGMSQSRFEHAFAEWAGISPKRYLAHLAKETAKSLLKSQDVLRAAHGSGLSGPGRLHGLMVTHEAVSPGEFKRGNIEIAYGIHPSPFGWCLIGVTKRGICYLSFLEEKDERLAARLIKEAWPKAHLVADSAVTAPIVKRIFGQAVGTVHRSVHLLIKGTNFQVKVWEALLAIPDGKVSSYTEIARAAGSPKAFRAAGTACGHNSIAFLIPCHRVLTSAGKIGGYRWGTERKEAILAWGVCSPSLINRKVNAKREITNHMLPLSSFINPEQLEDLASRSYFRYGKQIAEEGEIQVTKRNTFNIIATVKHKNSQARAVSLMSTTKGFRWKCTCTSKKGVFCQHCVAVGLAAADKKL